MVQSIGGDGMKSMRLLDIVHSISGLRWDQRFSERVITGISCDSREDQNGKIFVALSGFQVNGADFIGDAVAAGAAVIVTSEAERHRGRFRVPDHVAVLETADSKGFLRQAARIFYENPAAKVSVIGVTGTNGKTTTTYLLESIVHADQKHCGVMGTINCRVENRVYPAKNTTPGYLDNMRFLAGLADARVPWGIMEVSSHALEQGRVDGIDFSAAVFTNLTQDHLDYHKDMEKYFSSKTLLFLGLNSSSPAVINTDDPYGRRMLSLGRGKVLTYGIDSPAQVKAQNIDYQLDATVFEIVFPDGKMMAHTALIGKHNVYNILAAAACANALGFRKETIQRGLENLKSVPGRLEPVNAGQDFHVYIDYAHTEDGLIYVLKAMRTVSPAKIILVFGCGGDRDHGKRVKMGQAACALADYSIVTSDNPRSEAPETIIGEITAGFSRNNYEVCVDRQEAIGRALKIAEKGQIVLLAGKGHEEYQVLKERAIPFDERSIVKEILRGTNVFL